MFTPITDEETFLSSAIDKVTGMLKRKKDIWTHAAPIFENFDIHKDWGVNPIQWGLTMCGLKLNRLKKRWAQHQGEIREGFAIDPDAEDSLIDLASYAILTLGLLYRRKHQLEQFGPSEDALEQIRFAVEKSLRSPEGQAEIAKLAEEIMGEKIEGLDSLSFVKAPKPSYTAPPLINPQSLPGIPAQSQSSPDMYTMVMNGTVTEVPGNDKGIPLSVPHWHGTYESNEDPCYNSLCPQESHTS